MDKTVATMKPGEAAVIAGFSDEPLSVKLLEMGFLPGNVVVFNFAAPLGDPVCVNISGFDVSLRLEEAATISVID
ncbi:MAG: ferrous iron transport protein A [Bacteroidetes bacterium]|nr:ferrous iron transport protein A [Bacteroidota bacterium]MBS1977274.1 ferrous iron transport protein A [Bacteroidota bacterium]